MTKKRFFSPATVFLWVFLLALILWIGSGLLVRPAPKETAVATASMSVQYIDSMAQALEVTIDVTGETASNLSMVMKAENAGEITRILVKEGQYVHQGDIIMSLDLRDYLNKRDEATAQLEQRRIEYEAALQLYQSQRVAAAKLKQALAAIDSAQASVRLAQIQLDKRVIRAPFDGVISAIDVEEGEWVSDTSNARLGEIVSVEDMKVQAYLSEADSYRVQLGALAHVTIGTDQYSGKVSFLSPTAQPDTRTFKMDIILDPHTGQLKQGMNGAVQVVTEQIQAHFVPSSLLSLRDDGVIGVKTLSSDNHVIFNPVVLVRETPQGVWIQGLPSQVRIISIGHPYVKQGAKISTISEDSHALALIKEGVRGGNERIY